MRSRYWKLATLAIPFFAFVLPIVLWLATHQFDSGLWSWMYSPPVRNAHQLGLIVAFLAILLATPIAAASRLIRSRSWIVVIMLLVYGPLSLGMVARNYAWVGIFSDTNPLTTLGFSLLSPASLAYSYPAVLLVMSIIFLPWAFFILREALHQVTEEQIEASATCGASYAQTMRRLFGPAWARGAVLAFILCYTSSLGYFLTPQFVGGGKLMLPGNVMLTLVEQTQYPQASTLGAAFFLTCLPGIGAFLWFAHRQRTIFITDLPTHSQQSPYAASAPTWAATFSVLSIPGLYLSVLPVVYTFLWSLSGTGIPGRLKSQPTFEHFDQFFSRTDYTESFVLTLGLALLGSLLATLIVAAHDYTSRLRSASADFTSSILFLSPLLVPQVVFALALMLFIARVPIPVPIAEILAMSLLTLPVLYLISSAARPLLPDERVLAARSLGASPVRTIASVVWPSLRQSLIAGFGCAFFLSFDELVIASFIWHTEPDPMARKLYYELAYSSTPTAGVVAVLLVVGCAATVALISLGGAMQRRRQV